MEWETQKMRQMPAKENNYPVFCTQRRYMTIFVRPILFLI